MLCYTVDVMLAAAVDVMFYKSVVGGRSTTSLSGLWRNQPYSNCCDAFLSFTSTGFSS
jgi:hypothetical protein